MYIWTRDVPASTEGVVHEKGIGIGISVTAHRSVADEEADKCCAASGHDDVQNEVHGGLEGGIIHLRLSSCPCGGNRTRGHRTRNPYEGIACHKVAYSRYDMSFYGVI